MVRSGPYSSYNPYFFAPFLLWVIAGGIGIVIGEKESLFRLFNTHHTSLLNDVMPYVTIMGEGAFITVILLSLVMIPALRNWWYVILAVACPVVSSLLTQVIKSIVDAPRPLTYFNRAEWIHIMPGWHEYLHRSFPSGHTCGASAMFCLLACLLPRSYRAYGMVFFLLALSVGYSRMYLSAHFFADVYAGSIVGVLFTTFMLSLLRRYQSLFFKRRSAFE